MRTVGAVAILAAAAHAVFTQDNGNGGNGGNADPDVPVVHPGEPALPVELVGNDPVTPPVPDAFRPQTRPFGDEPPESPPDDERQWLNENLRQIATDDCVVDVVLTGWRWQRSMLRGRQSTALALSPEGTRVAVADSAGLTIRAANTGAALVHIRKGAGARRLVFSGNGRSIAVAGNPEWRGMIRVFDTLDASLKAEVSGDVAMASGPIAPLVAISRNGLVITDGRRLFHLGRFSTDDLPATVRSGRPAALAISDGVFDEDGDLIASTIAVAHGLGAVTLLEVDWQRNPVSATITAQRHVPLPMVRVTAMAFHPRGTLAIGDSDGGLWLATPLGTRHARIRDTWHLASGVTSVQPAMIRSNGMDFVVGGADGSLTFLNPKAGAESLPTHRVPEHSRMPSQWSPVIGAAAAAKAVEEGEVLRLREFLVALSDDGAVRFHRLKERRFVRMQPTGGGTVQSMVYSPGGSTPDDWPRLVVVRDRAVSIWRLPEGRDPWLETTLPDVRYRPEVVGFVGENDERLVLARGDAIEIRHGQTGALIVRRDGDVIGRQALALTGTRLVTGPVLDARAAAARPSPDLHLRDAVSGDLQEVIGPEHIDAANPDEPPPWRVGDSIDRLPPPPFAVGLVTRGRELLMVRLPRHPGMPGDSSRASPLVFFRLATAFENVGEPAWPADQRGYRRPTAGELPDGDEPAVGVATHNDWWLIARNIAATADQPAHIRLDRYWSGGQRAPQRIGSAADLPGTFASVALAADGNRAAVVAQDGRVTIFGGPTLSRLAGFRLPEADAGDATRVCFAGTGRVAVSTSRGALLLFRHRPARTQ